ncbi:MAG: hypothetical protein P9L99_00440 [Candidatus Lernaella stagnicola]|nr:hypothetical protein [Candidatus Lernaella stagnicola]
MTHSRKFTFRVLLLILLLCLIGLAACGDDDDDDNNDTAVDDDDDDDDNDDDDNDDDDDDNDDDNDDDDTTFDDLYLAPWPQENIEPADYDETVPAGDGRLKAEAYDEFHLDWHQPYYGSTVGTVRFTDETRAEVLYYGDFGDSCIWTGTYVVSQSLRYHVTGDAQAKTNAIRAVTSLDRHLHVTGRPGFIARYVATRDEYMYNFYGGDEWCDADENCHHVETGAFTGDWWDGNTSRDQYTGWFFAMATAYDLIDDQPTREMIRDDVTEVLDELISTNWWITDVDGRPTTRAPNVLSTQQLTWSLIGYHLTGEARFKAEVENWIADDKRLALRLGNITFMNRYGQYYGNNLGHQNFYSLLRLAQAYFGPEDMDFFRGLFDSQIHSFTRLSHNAFFNGIHMGQGIYEPDPGDDPYQDQLELDLTDFRDAPNWVYFVDPPDNELDPVSVFLDDLMTQFPFLAEIMGNVDPQSLEAHPVLEQCSTDFLWQRNPFRIEPCGSDDPSVTRPGVDYLVAYWLASYHKFIDKGF